jgi:hypothetical protein
MRTTIEKTQIKLGLTKRQVYSKILYVKRNGAQHASFLRKKKNGRIKAVNTDYLKKR